MAMNTANPPKVESVPPVEEIRDFGHLMMEVSASAGIPRVFWRGQLEGDLLVPTVFRDPSLREVRLAMDFRQVAPARMGEYPRDNEHAKWLVLMRHNGLPARLLDWSASPLVAVFFAVDADRAKDSSAVVWRLNALRLNQYQTRKHVLYNIGSWPVQEFAGRAFSKSPEKTPALKGREGGVSKPGVIAMAPYHFSHQHVAQQSCFTLHRDGKPMEQRGGSGEFLKRLVIPAEIKREVRERLAATGIERRYLFPDLPNLATALRELHGKSRGN